MSEEIKREKIRMKRNGWNVNTMNQYCIDNDIDYNISDIKKVDKGYQIQLWALIKCSNKNHESYWVWWNNFLNGFRCKKCYYDKFKMTEWNKNKAKDFYKEYGLSVVDISEWKDVDSCTLTIDSEGYKYITSITGLRQYGKSSFKYYKSNKYSLENIKNYCRLNRPDYDIVSEEYNGVKEEHTWIYKGNLSKETEPEFKLTVDSFINGGCGHPYFGKSNGEIIFENRLKENKIEYVRQKSFEKCRDKSTLFFDFYLPKYQILIEIDGQQHDTVIDMWGGIEGLKDRIKKDKIKNEFCKNNDLKLIRIKYTTNKLEKYEIDIKRELKEILGDTESQSTKPIKN